jgi:hypothetical protein
MLHLVIGEFSTYHELHKAVSGLNNMGNAVRMNGFGVFMKT